MTAPKNFVIISKPRREIYKVERNHFSLNDLMNFPGAWKALNQKWIENPDLLKAGEIRLLSEIDEFRHFLVRITYLRKGIASKDFFTDNAEFELWQHIDGFSLAVNATEDLAEIAAVMLSVGIYKDPFALRIRRMSKKDFLALVRYVKSVGGDVNILHLRWVRTEKGILSTFKISGRTLEEFDIEKLIEASKKVTRIGFYIPNLGGTEFKFWIAHWGGGTIYTPQILERHNIWSLILFFEKVLEN